MKTNKSYAKRLKVTKNGKIKSRRPGQNHFNLRDNSKTSTNKRSSKSITMSHKAASRFLVNLKNK
ncbi:MAG: 50S ribosomal protein L35 [Candidatus Taylorbacteria bacterium]|nr:50S ribosomal protein L35 [Candidatus Taylorbacteria bacterium]